MDFIKTIENALKEDYKHKNLSNISYLLRMLIKLGLIEDKNLDFYQCYLYYGNDIRISTNWETGKVQVDKYNDILEKWERVNND